MPKDPLINQLWKLYEKIPTELQEAIFSSETSDTIFDVCEKNNIENNYELSKIVGDSLLGILPPEEVEKNIKEKLSLSPEKANKVAREIDRFIFYPLKNSLAQLYGEELKEFKIRPEKKEEKKEKGKPKKTKKKEEKKGKDSYREPLV